MRDLAVIERAEFTLGRGLNAVTGETGAGKSLLVQAVSLLVGEQGRRRRGARGRGGGGGRGRVPPRGRGRRGAPPSCSREWGARLRRRDADRAPRGDRPAADAARGGQPVAGDAGGAQAAGRGAGRPPRPARAPEPAQARGGTAHARPAGRPRARACALRRDAGRLARGRGRPRAARPVARHLRRAQRLPGATPPASWTTREARGGRGGDRSRDVRARSRTPTACARWRPRRWRGSPRASARASTRSPPPSTRSSRRRRSIPASTSMLPIAARRPASRPARPPARSPPTLDGLEADPAALEAIEARRDLIVRLTRKYRREVPAADRVARARSSRSCRWETTPPAALERAREQRGRDAARRWPRRGRALSRSRGRRCRRVGPAHPPRAQAARLPAGDDRVRGRAGRRRRREARPPPGWTTWRCASPPTPASRRARCTRSPRAASCRGSCWP